MKNMATSRDNNMPEVPVVSYGDLSLTGALISIARCLFGILKKTRGVSIRRKVDEKREKVEFRKK
jgi:hypothetical protein